MAQTQTQSPTYLIRRATVNDCEDVARLCGDAEDLRQMAPQEAFPLTGEVVAGWLAERNSGYVLEDATGLVLAYAELNPDRHVSGRFWVGHLAVAPFRRGEHLGRRMVNALASTALQQMRAEDVWISAFADNPAALSCYRGCGFHDMGTRPVMGRTLVDLCRTTPTRQPIVILALSAGILLFAWAVWWWRQ